MRTALQSLGLITAVLSGISAFAQTSSQDEAASLLAQPCYGCHKPAGSKTPGMSELSALQPAAIAALLIAYKTDEQQGTVMNRISKGYTEAELQAIAVVVGQQPD